MKSFFREFSSIRRGDLHERLSYFIEEFKRAGPVTIAPPARLAFYDRTKDERGSFLNSLYKIKEDLNRKRKLGRAINLWKLAQIGQDELKNSSVLAWLLDEKGDHGQGNEILKEFLKQIIFTGNNPPLPEHCDRGYKTLVESCPFGDQESRIDIEIVGKNFLIFIEVKVNSIENNDQLDRYLRLAPMKAAGLPWGLVYLTRDGRLPERFRNSTPDYLVPVKWADLSAILKNHCHNLPSDSFAYNLIRQFANHIDHL